MSTVDCEKELQWCCPCERYLVQRNRSTFTLLARRPIQHIMAFEILVRVDVDLASSPRSRALNGVWAEMVI